MLNAPLPVDAKPICADPKWLPLVDAAFANPGGREAADLVAVACRECQVRTACLTFALTNGEHGTWGGSSANQRTRRRGRSLSFTFNLNGVHKGGPTPCA